MLKQLGGLMQQQGVSSALALQGLRSPRAGNTMGRSVLRA